MLCSDGFCQNVVKKIPIDGDLIKDKGIAYAKELGYTNFVGSTGWLDRWKRR